MQKYTLKNKFLSCKPLHEFVNKKILAPGLQFTIRGFS
jgi:hypothetical protein